MTSSWLPSAPEVLKTTSQNVRVKLTTMIADRPAPSRGIAVSPAADTVTGTARLADGRTDRRASAGDELNVSVAVTSQVAPAVKHTANSATTAALHDVA